MIVHSSVHFSEKLIANEKVNCKCPNCGYKNLSIRVYQKYGYALLVYWLVIWRGRDVTASCSNCEERFIKSSFTKDMLEEYKHLPKRIPWWMFSGWAMFVALMAGIVMIVIYNNKINEQLALNPKAGNVYNVKISDDRFTLFKINTVKGDSVYIIQNLYEVDNFSGINDLRDKPFSSDVLPVHKNRIKELYDSGYIRGISED